MKKLILILALALGLNSCSTDATIDKVYIVDSNKLICYAELTNKIKNPKDLMEAVLKVRNQTKVHDLVVIAFEKDKYFIQRFNEYKPKLYKIQ